MPSSGVSAVAEFLVCFTALSFASRRCGRYQTVVPNASCESPSRLEWTVEQKCIWNDQQHRRTWSRCLLGFRWKCSCWHLHWTQTGWIQSLPGYQLYPSRHQHAVFHFSSHFLPRWSYYWPKQRQSHPHYSKSSFTIFRYSKPPESDDGSAKSQNLTPTLCDLELELLTHKVDRFVPLTCGPFCQFASKSVHSISKYCFQCSQYW